MSFLQTISEGGQTWIHKIRMIKQVLKISFGFSALIAALFFFFQMTRLPEETYWGSWYYIKASLLESIQEEISVDREAWSRVANEFYSRESPSIRIPQALYKTEFHWKSLLSKIAETAESSGTASSVSFAFLLAFFWLRGRKTSKKSHLSGKKLISPRRLSWKIQAKRRASPIKIGPVPYIKGSETQHTLITGGTGSGKTNCLHGILSQLRKQCFRAVVVDTDGAFVSRYFRQGRDILLNPFDERSSPWHLWSECKNPFDYDSVAESFIPTSHNEHENYWRRSAQAVFSALLAKTSERRKSSDLVNWMLSKPLSDLCCFLSETKAASHLDIRSEKTASSVRSVTSSFLSCLQYLPDTDSSFSIKKWIEEEHEGWLFLNCGPSQRRSIAPLLVSWISIAIEGLLSLKPDLKRRLWFVLDELQTLNRIHGLDMLLTESRKYGGCALLSLQSPSQLEEIYGRDKTRVILGNCSTKIAFSEQDPEVAERVSKAFGDCEIREFQRGISYGANDVRDGVNLSVQQRERPIVKASDIQSLRNNEAFLKLAGDVPVSKIRLSLI